MAKRKRKATLHSANRVTEAEILDSARALADDPALAMPICEHGCVWFSPVAAARRGILKAHAARDDKAKLERLARGGNDLARAYAATLLVAKAEKLPFVADLRLPSGNIPYVIRGKAKPFYLAGLQHHEDRALRLLSVAPFVKKRGLHFYSADRGIVCTGKRDAPPRDFVEEEAAMLGLHAQGSDRFTCGHDDAEGVRLGWRAAGVTLFRCLACADEESTLHALVRHIAAPRPSRMFDVDAQLTPLRALAGAAPPAHVDLPEKLVDEYRAGRLRDKALLDAARAERVAALRRQGARVLVAGDASYGDDTEAFLEALRPTEAEARALRAALEAHEGAVVLDKPTSARALAELWPQHGLRMLQTLAKDDEAAKRLHKETVTPEEASDLVRRAARESATRAIDASLPRYARLPPAAQTADRIARAYRTEGSDAAARVAIERAGAGKGRALALAALESLGAAKGQEWRFTHEDQEIAQTLAPVVERLLRGDASEYHEALTLASRLSGETDRIETS